MASPLRICNPCISQGVKAKSRQIKVIFIRFSICEKTSNYSDPRGEKFQETPRPLHNFFGLYTAPLLPECLIYLHPDQPFL
jgi:hypothetical protein